ncbi:MAG: divalent cation transporter [Planctomycetaceae bacterium]|nr:divalent cation transporter [Planctomycetaceae bacterium]
MIPEYLQVIALTLMAGGAMPVGGAIAWFEKIRPQWLEREFRHTVIAFGGGALLSAVALVLVPEGTERLSLLPIILSLSAGGLAFLGLDLYLAKSQTSASQLAAMLADFLPEALALGASFALGNPTGLLLALLIALQNLPEGFNAYRELRESTKLSPFQLIGAFSLMALLGPVAGLIGYFVLASFPATVSAIMLFAAGGILYLVFQDIAPQSRLERHWTPPLGAVAGFLLGVIGEKLTNS